MNIKKHAYKLEFAGITALLSLSILLSACGDKGSNSDSDFDELKKFEKPSQSSYNYGLYAEDESSENDFYAAQDTISGECF